MIPCVWEGHVQHDTCVQAKSNASKYTGVSSDDLKNGGFGAKSSGFGSSATSTFGLSRKYSGGLSSSGMGSTGGFGSSSRSAVYHDYDEPYDSVCSLIHISLHARDVRLPMSFYTCTRLSCRELQTATRMYSWSLADRTSAI